VVVTTALSPGERAIRTLPPRLRRFVVPQDYAAYTPRDQAVWRHILRRLVKHLVGHAHPSYLRGLEATGIGTERIPSMDEMNEKLSRLAWSAVSVRGFIPPAVFTELQSMRVLAIAGDIRTHEHIEYTPAPDIVHESAGHAPILADPAYASFLQSAGELGFRAIASVEDQEVYEAIRALSIVKEDPAATPGEIAASERRLAEANASRRFVSEATRASRLYWWTAEYGLVGTPDEPKIYGAGLLSSIGESTHCFSDEVQRIPLDVGAADVEFDITRMQPQLFVARDFEQLEEVVEELARTLAWRRGGDHGLRQALAARTVNHLALDDGTTVTGVVEALHPRASLAGHGLSTALAVLRGPTLLARAGKALRPPEDLPALVAFGLARAPEEGPFRLSFASGLALSGRIADGAARELRASIGSRELDLPVPALLLTSSALPSVAGGPGDPGIWDERFGTPAPDEEGEARARAHKASALAPRLAELYREVRILRESGRTDRVRLADLAAEARRFPGEWLLHAEVEELAAKDHPESAPRPA
jgi:phenylalanine-4-hydroxylase